MNAFSRALRIGNCRRILLEASTEVFMCQRIFMRFIDRTNRSHRRLALVRFYNFRRNGNTILNVNTIHAHRWRQRGGGEGNTTGITIIYELITGQKMKPKIKTMPALRREEAPPFDSSCFCSRELSTDRRESVHLHLDTGAVGDVESSLGFPPDKCRCTEIDIFIFLSFFHIFLFFIFAAQIEREHFY